MLKISFSPQLVQLFGLANQQTEGQIFHIHYISVKLFRKSSIISNSFISILHMQKVYLQYNGPPEPKTKKKVYDPTNIINVKVGIYQLYFYFTIHKNGWKDLNEIWYGGNLYPWATSYPEKCRRNCGNFFLYIKTIRCSLVSLQVNFFFAMFAEYRGGLKEKERATPRGTASVT